MCIYMMVCCWYFKKVYILLGSDYHCLLSTDRLGYNEKYYFTPSDDSFKVWNTVRTPS